MREEARLLITNTPQFTSSVFPSALTTLFFIFVNYQIFNHLTWPQFPNVYAYFIANLNGVSGAFAISWKRLKEANLFSIQEGSAGN
jgi:hypothetical protein